MIFMLFALKYAAIHSLIKRAIMGDANDLILIFERCFLKEFNTILVTGGDEPEYLPADSGNLAHRVIFTKDYYSSALHEAAHWCIAGEKRRKLTDFGYWYSPDGRTEQQQAAFERVEVRPQALEWIFTEASGGHFRASADNLLQGLGASDHFKKSIVAQAKLYCEQGLAERPRRFATALQRFYNTRDPFDPIIYSIESL